MSQHFLQAVMNCLPVLGHGLQATLHICWEGWGADREPDRSQALESQAQTTQASSISQAQGKADGCSTSGFLSSRKVTGS